MGSDWLFLVQIRLKGSDVRDQEPMSILGLELGVCEDSKEMGSWRVLYIIYTRRFP